MKTIRQDRLARVLAGTAATLALFFAPGIAARAQVIAVRASAPAAELVGHSWLNTPGNAPLRLAGRRGKVTIVEFWTRGCVNCRRNLPAYNRLHERFAPKNVVLIGIHTPETPGERDPARLARFVKEQNITYPILHDAQGANWNRWNQEFWPTVYLLDKQNRVRYRWEGELAYNGANGEARIARRVEQLLAETKKP